MRRLKKILKHTIRLLLISFVFVHLATPVFAASPIEAWGRNTIVGDSNKTAANKWTLPARGGRIYQVANHQNAEEILLVYSADGKTITRESVIRIKDLPGMRLGAGHYRFHPLLPSLRGNQTSGTYWYVSFLVQPL